MIVEDGEAQRLYNLDATIRGLILHGGPVCPKKLRGRIIRLAGVPFATVVCLECHRKAKAMDRITNTVGIAGGVGSGLLALGLRDAHPVGFVLNVAGAAFAIGVTVYANLPAFYRRLRRR